MPSIEKKLTELEILELETLGAPPPKQDTDFARLLRHARLRAAAGNPVPQATITQRMLDDPIHGEFWRQMQEARERVARLRPDARLRTREQPEEM